MIGGILAAGLLLAEVSPYAPAQIIPASEKTASGETVAADAGKPARRARLPFERRKEHQFQGVVTYDFGKTASGEKTHIYRLMGKGGAVLDVTDFGARAVRAYSPGKSGALTDTIGGPNDVIDFEKAGVLEKVWTIFPVRRPDSTSLVFTLDAGTNGVSKIIHTLDSKNLWTTETTRGTNATIRSERKL